MVEKSKTLASYFGGNTKGLQRTRTLTSYFDGNTKGFQLGKTGKSMQGKCVRRNGKIICIYEDGTIDTMWENEHSIQ